MEVYSQKQVKLREEEKKDAHKKSVFLVVGQLRGGGGDPP